MQTIPVGKLHIDQIDYLLTERTRQRAGLIRDKLNDRDVNSNEAKRLAIAGASNDAIAPYAKAASDAQAFVSETYTMIDRELATIVAIDAYLRKTKASPSEQPLHEQASAALTEAAKPFGTVQNLIAALAPYYNRTDKQADIDAMVASSFANGHPLPFVQRAAAAGQSQETAAYDLTEYKRIWTYLSRKDVKHTEKRLKKMREEVAAARAAGMPNIDAMEAICQKEAELVLAEQQKRISLEGPALL